MSATGLPVFDGTPHLSGGEMEVVRQAMPARINAQWEGDEGA